MPQGRSDLADTAQLLGNRTGLAQRARRALDIIPGLKGVPLLRTLRGRPLNVITNDAAGLAYFPIPKIASSTLKAAMYKLEMGEGAEPTHDELHAHYHYRGENWVTLKQARAMPHFRFAVVRDPLARFVSGYTNRVVRRKDHIETPAMARALARQGLSDAPSLEEFSENLDAYCAVSLSLKWHFRPQIEVLGARDYLDAVYDMDGLAALTDDVRSKCGVELELGQQNVSTEPVVDVSAAVRRIVAERYAADYTAFAELYVAAT